MAEFSDELVALLPRLRRFARSMTGKADEADDLVQAALERALRAQSSWEPGSRLDAWMFRILKNLWIDQIRRRKMEGVQVPFDDAEQLAGSDGRAVADSRLILADVRKLLAQLPVDQQAVVQSVCVDELSYRDTADELNIPIGTVMSRLARARLALAAMMRPEVKAPAEKTPVSSS
jgi:RNA polymerase sigma-70 factor (ECF subfamily)